jgi:hypothetical protein
MRQLPRFPTLKRTDGSPDSYIEEAFASIVDLVHVLEIDSVSGIERDRLAREVDIWVARLYGFEPSIAEEIAELDLDEVRG